MNNPKYLKNILFLFAVLSLMSFSDNNKNGKSYTFTLKETLKKIQYKENDLNIIQFTGSVSNKQDTLSFLEVHVIPVDIPGGWDFTVCTNEKCHSKNVTPVPYNLKVGETGLFIFDFYVNNLVGTDTAKVKIKIFDSKNSNDTSVVNVTGIADPDYVYISEPSETSLINISAVYPNPVQSFGTIHYKTNQNNSLLEIIDIHGKLQNKMLLFPSQNSSVIINSHQYAPGTYFYRLNAGGQLSDSFRMIILN